MRVAPIGGYFLQRAIPGAPPERGASFKLAVHQREVKIVILVYERVTKSATKWKKWGLKRSILKDAKFWQK